MPTTLNDLLPLSRRELREVVVGGHPIDPTALDDRAYHGVSLAMPRLIQPFAWVKFFKTFHRDPATGALRGWNAQAEQTPLDQPWVYTHKRGDPVTYGHYKVVPPDGMRVPEGFDRGLVLDYTTGENSVFELFRFARDPLVAVEEGSVDLLLGVSWAALGPLTPTLPFYFALLRGPQLDHVVQPPRRR